MSTTVRFDVSIKPNEGEKWALAGWLELPLGRDPTATSAEIIANILDLDMSNVRVELER